MLTRRSLFSCLTLVISIAVLGATLQISSADTFRPVVRGRRGVVAGGQPLSVEAGMRILQRGGNAVDAGVATILAASVIEFSHFSIGGEVPILIKLKGKDVAVVEGMGTAPAKATLEFFVDRAKQRGAAGTTATAPDSSATLRAGSDLDMPSMPGAKSGLIPSTGPLAATVPAVLDACVTALDQFGTKSLADDMQPHGGLLAAADLAGWHAKIGAPAKGVYRGYEVYKTGFWAQGPMMIEVLNVLEGYDLKKMGQNSPEYIHTVTEALKLGFADRDRFYADPNFVPVPTQQLLSKDYAAMRRSLIDQSLASLAQRPGDPVNMKPLLASVTTISYNAPPLPEIEKANDTTCVNVIDKEGNMFSATPSGAWLPAVVAGDTGVLMGQRLQSALTDASSPNVAAPGKRPRITLTPTLVLKDGQPYMVLSTPGGDNQDQALLQVLLNVIVFGMNPQEAVEAPRFDTQHYVSSFDNHEFMAGLLNIESRIPTEVISQLGSRGHKLKIQSPWGTGSSPTVIMYDVKSGVISGGADPRRGRYAVAW